MDHNENYARLTKPYTLNPKMIESKKTTINTIKPTKKSLLLLELRRADQHQDATCHSDGSDSYSETFGSALEQHLDKSEQHLDTTGEE